MSYGEYIYLHFLDRELRMSIGKSDLSDAVVNEWIRVATFMTDKLIYVSLSHMYESLEKFPNSIKLIYECESIGKARMVSNQRNFDEFIESRKNMYDFDKKRYTVYFDERKLDWPQNLITSDISSTDYLREKLPDQIKKNNVLGENVIDNVQNSLIANKNDAITIQRFIPIIEKTVENSYKEESRNTCSRITELRIEISKLYTKRYLQEFNGTIVTGLPGFAVYDNLASNPVETLYPLFKALLKPIFYFISTLDNKKFVVYRYFGKGKELRNVFSKIAECCICLKTQNVCIYEMLIDIQQRLEKVKSAEQYKDACYKFFFDLVRLCEERGIKIPMQKKFLIVVATQIELTIVIQEMKDKANTRPQLENDVSYHIGEVNHNIIYIVKCQMGTNGPGGSTLATDEAIRKFSPDYVIICGVAWGGNEDDEKLGEVLISDKVWEYDPAKINMENEKKYRGHIMPASPRLVQMFETMLANGHEIKAHVGLIASGSLLLNNQSMVQELKSEHPNLIGGDMETCGIAAACERANKDWIMVKGICDWGHNKDAKDKDSLQKNAAKNAVCLVVEVLENFGNRY